MPEPDRPRGNLDGLRNLCLCCRVAADARPLTQSLAGEQNQRFDVAKKIAIGICYVSKSRNQSALVSTDQRRLIARF